MIVGKKCWPLIVGHRSAVHRSVFEHRIGIVLMRERWGAVVFVEHLFRNEIFDFIAFDLNYEQRKQESCGRTSPVLFTDHFSGVDQQSNMICRRSEWPKRERETCFLVAELDNEPIVIVAVADYLPVASVEVRRLEFPCVLVPDSEASSCARQR